MNACSGGVEKQQKKRNLSRPGGRGGGGYNYLDFWSIGFGAWRVGFYIGGSRDPKAGATATQGEGGKAVGSGGGGGGGALGSHEWHPLAIGEPH